MTAPPENARSSQASIAHREHSILFWPEWRGCGGLRTACTVIAAILGCSLGWGLGIGEWVFFNRTVCDMNTQHTHTHRGATVCTNITFPFSLCPAQSHPKYIAEIAAARPVVVHKAPWQRRRAALGLGLAAPHILCSVRFARTEPIFPLVRFAAASAHQHNSTTAHNSICF